MYPKISVIIPVFNVEQYIEECLNSVITQTYTKNVECILVDDCGQDNSIAIAESFIAHNKTDVVFRIIRHPHNKGLSAARNTGIVHAHGDWLFFLDSDDWLLPDCLLSIVSTAEKFPGSEIVISSTISENEWVARESLVGDESIPDYTEDRLWIMNALLSRPVKIPISAWNKLYLKQFVINNNLSFLEGYTREDEIWSFHYSKCVKRVAFNKQGTYYYRVNPNGIVNTSKQYKSISFSLDVVSHYLDNVTSFGKDIQLRLISRMLLDAYMRLHHDSQMLKKCKALSKQLYGKSGLKRKLGCVLMIYVPHWLFCKKPIYIPTRKYLLGINN